MSALDLLRIKDGGAQMRVEMRPESIDEYAAEMLNGATFPPVIVYYDGTDYWLGDGFHRVEAARKIDREAIEADIREGTARDAILHGIGANATHGMRRTQADKRHSVARLLADPDWARWSDRKIAQVAKVDHKTAGKVRRELSGEIPIPQPHSIGEIPTPSGKPKERQSMILQVLRTVSDDDLITECSRRGLPMEAPDA